VLNYGLDVHKRYTSFCVMDDSGQLLTEGKCANGELTTHPAFSLRGSKRGVMEASGNWSYLYDLLEPLFESLTLAHPLRVRAIAAARVKTDAIDARTLAHLLRADLIPPAYVPDHEVRELRELLRFRLDLVKQRTALKNRVHALLAKDGLNSPYTDLFGRHGREWLAGLRLRDARRRRVDGFLRALDAITAEIKLTETEIKLTAKADRQARLLCDIPGIAELSALTILAELGDIGRFPDALHLVSYTGLAPSVRSSGGKTRLGHVTKQGPSALRWVLIEATHIAVRKPGRLRERYLHLRRGKSSSVAIMACAREMLVAIYHVLSRGEAFRTGGSSQTTLTSEVA
jgi:transposase